MSVNKCDKKKQNLYDVLYIAVGKAYSTNTKQFCQEKTNEVWNDLKKKFRDKVDFHNNTYDVIRKLEERGLKRKSSYTNFFVQVNYLIIIHYRSVWHDFS